MKKATITKLLFALLIPYCSITAFATQRTTVGSLSSENVEYKEFVISRENLERGTQEQCTVTVSQPYSYSTEIPKNPSNNGEQTGMETILNDKETNLNNGNSSGSNNGNNSNVQTSDETPIILYTGLTAISAIGMLGVKAKSKKCK